MDTARQYLLELGSALVAIPIIWSVTLAVRRGLVHRFHLPLGARYKVACGALSAYLPLQIYQWIVAAQAAAHAKTPSDITINNGATPPDPFLWPDLLLQGLLAIFIFFGALVLVQLVRKYFWDGWFERNNAGEAPKFLSDMGSACIVGASLLVIATQVYHKDLSGFQLSSTVSVAVIGFAAQDLLGNLLAGIALHIGSPFRKGDWLMVDGRRLQVREVNWRSTRMRSRENVQVDVPNKTIAGSTIVNLSAPTLEQLASVELGFEYAAKPEAVKECLLRAARSANGVLQEPSPKALLKSFGEATVHYELRFWVKSEEAVVDALDAVRTRIWHEAAQSGLKMPLPAQAVFLEQVVATTAGQGPSGRV